MKKHTEVKRTVTMHGNGDPFAVYTNTKSIIIVVHVELIYVLCQLYLNQNFLINK